MRNQNRVPLTIGVTGHRDLIPEELPLLRDRVRSFLRKLQTDHPDLNLRLLTPIAEGADQLVTDIAIEMGIEITILLPMPREMYAEDFSDHALEKYNALLKEGDIVELPVVRSDDAEPTHIDRERQYVQLGVYLAAHSHIVLAIWDGKDNYAPGGTTAVVRFHQHESLLPLNADDPKNPVDFAEDESDLVHHIVCSRTKRGDPAPPLHPGETYWLTRHDIAPRTSDLPDRYNVVFQRMAEFQNDLRRTENPKEFSLLHGVSRTSQNDAPEIENLFHYADDLAGKYQRLTMLALRAGHLGILLAGTSFIVYADILSNDLMIYAYLFFISSVLAAFMIENRLGWQRKYLDYRVLAEALRVQFYWNAAGVKMDTEHHFAHDAFHERRDLQLAWIRNVMRVAGLKANSKPVTDPQALDAVISSWITSEQSGQQHYYQRKSQQRARASFITRILEIMGSAIVILVAFTLVLGGKDIPASNVLIAIVGFLPFLVAVRQSYVHRTAERELIGQYNYYSRIFSNAVRLIERASSDDTRRAILLALGKAALDESNQWVLRQRERPSGPVISG